MHSDPLWGKAPISDLLDTHAKKNAAPVPIACARYLLAICDGGYDQLSESDTLRAAGNFLFRRADELDVGPPCKPGRKKIDAEETAFLVGHVDTIRAANPEITNRAAVRLFEANVSNGSIRVPSRYERTFLELIAVGGGALLKRYQRARASGLTAS